MASKKIDLRELGDQVVLGLGLSFALRNGLLEHLRTPRTLAELSARLRMSESLLRGAAALLCELGLVERSGEKYHATAAAREEFRQGAPLRYQFETLTSQLVSSQRRIEQRWRRQLPRISLAALVPEIFFYTSARQMRSFSGYTAPNASEAGRELARIFDFTPYARVCDLGGNDGSFLAPLLEAFPSLEGTVIDLPPVRRLFEEKAASRRLANRLTFHAADFFSNPLPASPVYTCGYVLHDWPEKACGRILRNLARAIPSGGLLILHENLLDHPREEVRRKHAISNYVMVALGETRGGAHGERTSREYASWLASFGFEAVDVKYADHRSFLFFRRGI